MSDAWVTPKRLREKGLDRATVDAIQEGLITSNTRKQLINVRSDGSARTVNLDSDAGKIGQWVDF